MNSLSNSTLLVNCLIALSTKNPDFPYPLWTNGFQIETIEPRILLSDGSRANPDLQLKRNNDALLFFECKDGHCEKDQLDRYKKITLEDIKRNHITSLSEPILFDLAYFTSKSKEEKIIQSVEKDGNTFPILIFENTAIKLNPLSNEFKNPLLNEILKEILLSKPVPQSYLPFMVDDDDRTIMCALLQHFISKIEYQFTLEQLLEELFSHLIHNYSPQGIADLKARLAKLLKKLMESDDFMHVLAKKEHVYHFKTNAPKNFMKTCEKLIKAMEEEKRKEEEVAKPDPQATLHAWLPPT